MKTQLKASQKATNKGKPSVQCKSVHLSKGVSTKQSLMQAKPDMQACTFDTGTFQLEHVLGLPIDGGGRPTLSRDALGQELPDELLLPNPKGLPGVSTTLKKWGHYPKQWGHGKGSWRLQVQSACPGMGLEGVGAQSQYKRVSQYVPCI